MYPPNEILWVFTIPVIYFREWTDLINTAANRVKSRKIFYDKNSIKYQCVRAQKLIIQRDKAYSKQTND